MKYELKQVEGMRGVPTLTFRADDCGNGAGIRVLIPDGQVFEIFVDPDYLEHPKVYFHFGDVVQDEGLPYPDESEGR